MQGEDSLRDDDKRYDLNLFEIVGTHLTDVKLTITKHSHSYTLLQYHIIQYCIENQLHDPTTTTILPKSEVEEKKKWQLPSSMLY